jgi:hypothetical protein
MDRRSYLVGICASLGLTTGCLGGNSSGGGERSATETETTLEDLPEWTRSTDCDGMADSVVKVKWMVSELDGEYAPIQFAELSAEEQSLTRKIVENGGVGVCERSDAFERFVDRVKEAIDAQREHGSEYSMAYLAYEGRYYGLYVKVTDMVISYE